MDTYDFILIISPPTVDFEEASNRLYSSGCDDALFYVREGNRYAVDFSREATSYLSALTSALEDIRKSNIGSHIVKVE